MSGAAPVTSPHRIPVGSAVVVILNGVPQAWGRVEVVRHDRNSTYRLFCIDSGTWVTAHENELAVLA